jgi:hypothetical protein
MFWSYVTPIIQHTNLRGKYRPSGLIFSDTCFHSILRVPDQGNSRNASCALNLISTFLLNNCNRQMSIVITEEFNIDGQCVCGVSELLLFNARWENYQLSNISLWEQDTFQWNDDDVSEVDRRFERGRS